MHELSTLLERFKTLGAHESLDLAFDWISSQSSPTELGALAEWALDRALEDVESDRYGIWHMVAGAAKLRIAQLRGGASLSPELLISGLGALQDRIDDGLSPSRGLGEFGELIGATELSEYLDMRLRTEPDDTVFFWTSGACAFQSRRT
ncbi:MAG: hypothetical protein HY791_06135 [Deltaproteobacteria bacterium]|nr:hypothetical protein [Deltaproteobacteria bacterium]